MERCTNCGRRIAPSASPPLCHVCASCETMYDVIMARLKRLLFAGLRSAVVFSAAAIALRLTELFSGSGLVSLVLFYLALSEVVLSVTQFLVSYVQLKKKLRQEQESSK